MAYGMTSLALDALVAQVKSDLQDKVEDGDVVTGSPQNFALRVEMVAAGILNSQEQALVAISTSKSKAAAIRNNVNTTDPQSGNTTVSTIVNIIQQYASDLASIAAIPQEIKDVESNATAEIHWYGWKINLNAAGVSALVALQKNGVKEIASLLVRFAGVSVPLAAMGEVINLVAPLVAGDVQAAAGRNGVSIVGKYWADIELDPIN